MVKDDQEPDQAGTLAAYTAGIALASWGISKEGQEPLSSAYDTFSDWMDRLDYDLTGGQGYDLREVAQAPGGASAGGSIWYAL